MRKSLSDAGLVTAAFSIAHLIVSLAFGDGWLAILKTVVAAPVMYVVCFWIYEHRRVLAEQPHP